ncbi:uncharacterized protein LOC144514275 [Sander vitreus]
MGGSGSTPRRSRDFSPDLSELMNKLIKHAALFIREFDIREQKMREIVREFRKMADEVRKMQQRTDTVKTAGGVTAGVGLGLLALAAPFTGGTSLAAAAAFTAGALVAATGGSVISDANEKKTRKENESEKKVGELGKEFMKMVDRLKNDLEEIKRTCEKVEQRSAELQAENTLTDMKRMCEKVEQRTAECQAEVNLTDMEEFHSILRRVSELADRIEEVLSAAVKVMSSISDLLLIFTVTATPEKDIKLRNSIMQSADRCQEVVDDFDQMKKELKDFTEKKYKQQGEEKDFFTLKLLTACLCLIIMYMKY